MNSLPRLLLPTSLLLTFVSACSSVSHRADIAECLAQIEQDRLRVHVQALEAIGPRPVSNPVASQASLDYLTEHLAAAGFEVRYESFDVQLGTKLFAVVRRADSPEAEEVELEVAPDLLLCGNLTRKAKSAQLTSQGWTVEGYRGRMGAESMTYTVSNLIATRVGVTQPERFIELSAHYDTVPDCSGAADNSSGVAALLELARVLADKHTSKSIRLCFFAGEEIGLRGSQEHMKRLQADDATTVEALINLDSIGFTSQAPGSQTKPEALPWYLPFPDVANFVLVIGTFSTGWLGNDFEAAIDAYVPDLPYYSANRIGGFFRDGERSDHAHYWRADSPAIFVTDSGEFRSDAYHSPHDTADSLDYEFIESITKAALATTLHLAKLTPSEAASQ